MGRARPLATHFVEPQDPRNSAMFIELAEYLRCHGDHEETYLVMTPDRVENRVVLEGTVGCPRCRREYRIEEGLVDFLPPDVRYTPPEPAAGVAPETIRALMGMTGPGGYAVLLGSAGSLAPALARLLDGVHLVTVNPPAMVKSTPEISRLRAIDRIPLRGSMARAVVVGAEHASAPWLEDACRILLRGLRLVSLTETPGPVGATVLAVGDGMWVGQKA